MATQAAAEQSAGKPRILRIGIIQGGRIVEERLVRKRENISVGQSAKNMFVVPSDALPRTWMLFEATSRGYIAHFGDGMDARIAVGQEIISLSQLKQGGKIQKTGQSWDMVLDERARGKITVGDLTILFQFVTPPPPQPRPQLPASVRGNFSSNLDWFFTSVAVSSFVVHLCMIIYLRSVDWPKKPDIEEIPDRFVQMVVKKKEPPPEEKKTDEKKKDDEKKPEEVAKKAAPKKEDKPAEVKKELTEAEKQKIAEEKARADAERRAKIAEQVQNTGILKLLGARADGEGAIADVLGKGDVDRDQEKAFEGVGGLTVATGDDGLRGVKSGTGGSGKGASISGLRGGGSIEGASTGSVGGEKSVKAVVSSAAPSVDGELDPNIVAKEVKRRLGAVKVCYERALKRNPALSGKIVVVWTITPEGTVTGIDVENDSLGDPEVAQCIKKNISGWRFPRPAGGSVEVSFPFVFQASS
ncbi:MAG: AgmX/PglI C-terminal domain-containing protein [Deltaproteobacteria bacterium]|nr:AgmX/PglI C-terminal domain-containing protein [Deltaproteobacteria bacterium]